MLGEPAPKRNSKKASCSGDHRKCGRRWLEVSGLSAIARLPTPPWQTAIPTASETLIGGSLLPFANSSSRRRQTLDPDVAGTLHGAGEIVSRLKAVPGFRAPTERFVRSDRHLRRYASTSIDDVRELLAADAKTPCRLRYGQTQRLDAVMSYGQTRMWWVLHRYLPNSPSGQRHVFWLIS